MSTETETLRLIGKQFLHACRSAGLTQDQVASLAGITRPRYRDIETGVSAARTTTLINIARALWLEMMLIPQAIIPATEVLMHPDAEDDRPAFRPHPENDDDNAP